MLKIDLHIHTLASGHAYNTILEYINRAKELKMKIIGISDHGPALYGCSTNEYYFKVINRIPRVINGVTVLKGVEANIINAKGELDISDAAISRLDYVMAAFHADTTPKYRDAGRKKNTAVIVRAIRSGKIDILTHPFFTQDYDVDMEVVASEACRQDVLLELNISSFAFRSPNQKMIDDVKIMVDVIRRNKKKLIINSDAHTIWQLGDDKPLEALKGQVKIEKEMIINNYPEELLEFLNIQL